MPNQKRTEKRVNKTLRVPPKNAGFWQVFWYRLTVWSVRNKFWQKFGIVVLTLVVFFFGTAYGISQWYINKHKNVPFRIGATFIPDYARYYDLDPRETLTAMVDDLGVKHLRLVSYWENMEKERDVYNFDELDWQMDLAAEKGAKVSLSIGLRQPRWPECHMPSWAEKLPESEWEKSLFKYLEVVTSRYKNHPALESYQLENEYLMSEFGICPDITESRLQDRLSKEYDIVKRVDPAHTLIISRSNNYLPTWPASGVIGDVVGISVYKRVWDKYLTNRYFDYPLPAWYYGFLAGVTEIATGKDTIIHELQTEAWTPSHLGGIKEVSRDEQYKSLSPSRLVDRIEYARGTGMRTMDLWGVEWWYWRKAKQNDPELWNTAKAELKKFDELNKELQQKN